MEFGRGYFAILGITSHLVLLSGSPCVDNVALTGHFPLVTPSLCRLSEGNIFFYTYVWGSMAPKGVGHEKHSVNIVDCLLKWLTAWLIQTPEWNKEFR